MAFDYRAFTGKRNFCSVAEKKNVQMLMSQTKSGLNLAIVIDKSFARTIFLLPKSM